MANHWTVVLALNILALGAALAAPTLHGAHVGALIEDAGTGRVLYARNADDAFQPASTMKLLVGSAALSLLGPGFTIETDALSDAPIVDGTLTGDLYLRGAGDPTLDAADLDDAARALRRASIARISGAVCADASVFTASRYPPGWVIDDQPYDYAAAVTGLAYQDNAVALRILPGETPGSPVHILTTPPDISIANRASTGDASSTDTSDIRWGTTGQNLEITGNIPAGMVAPDELDAAVPHPVAYAINRFTAALARAGVSSDAVALQRPAPSGSLILWRHHSDALTQLLARMWLPSDNVLAESLLEVLGNSRPEPGASDTRASGITAEQRWLRSIGVNSNTMTIADGSGLSQYDRATPTALATMLRADWASPHRAEILAALPVAGKSGTLAHAFVDTPIAGALIAKTGSMSHVRALAGFLHTANGGSLIVVLLINDWMDTSNGASAAVRAAEQAFFEAAM